MYTMLSDGTSGCEVCLCHSALHWPYLTEASLISAIVSIFVPSWCCGPSPLADTLLLRPGPWLYFNLLLKDSQARLAFKPDLQIVCCITCRKHDLRKSSCLAETRQQH
jgi:hypothetical protein